MRYLPYVSASALLIWAYAVPVHAEMEKGEDAHAPIAKEMEAASGHSLSGNYLSSRFARTAGDEAVASDYLMRALHRDPGNPDLLNQALRVELSRGRMKEAISYARKLDARERRDPMADVLLAIDAIQKKAYDHAATIVDGARANEGFNAILLPLMSAWLDLPNGKIQKPVQLEKTTDSAGNFAPFVYYHLALLNDLSGYKNIAEDYYKKSSSDASRLPYRVVEALGNFYQRQGKKDNAQKLYDDYRAANPESFLSESDLGDASALGANDGGKAGNDIKPLAANVQEGVAEIFFTFASILYSEDVPEETLLNLRLALYMRPDLAAAQLMLGSVQEQLEDYDAALAAYTSISGDSSFGKKAKLRSALVYDKLGKTREALKLLDGIVKANPSRNDAVLTMGDIYRAHSRFTEAAAAYSEAIAGFGEAPKRRTWPVFYMRGICYERIGEWDKAEKDFKQALALEPDQPDVLNYLGYSWLLMNRHVQKAKAMIEKAVAARPQDAHIVDSMGWALFSLGEYTQAIGYLEKAVDLMPGDPTVNEHLGDVYWRVGRKTEARYQWERALLFKPEKSAASDIRKKLQQGLPEETSRRVDAPRPGSDATAKP